MTITKSKLASKTEIATQLNRARYACERTCDRLWQERIHKDRPRNNQRDFGDLVESIEQGEREHMAFWSRLLGHHPSRRSTTSTRIAYFVVNLLAVEKHAKPAWDEIVSMRRDWQIAVGIQFAIGRSVFRKAIAEAGCDLALLDSLDYAKDLA